jgi:hypothetical protein
MQAKGPRVHALVLLRRRLQGLFGRSFQLEVRSALAEGTTVTMRIQLLSFGKSPHGIGQIFANCDPYLRAIVKIGHNI